MRGTLSKLFLTATLLLTGGVASADEWRGSTTDTRPLPIVTDRDHRDDGGDDNRNDRRDDRGDDNRNDRRDNRGYHNRNDGRDGRNDGRGGYGRNDRNDAPPQARVEHYRPRRGFIWVSGEWARSHGRWVWMPGHYERRGGMHRGGSSRY